MSVAKSPPQSLWATTLNRFMAFKHLAFRFHRWGMKLSLLSNVMPKNFASLITGIVMLLMIRIGSKWVLCKLQKWMQTVLVLENLKPFSSAHVCNLFRHCCSCLSIDLICFDRQQAEKSSTNSELSVPGFIQFTMPLIFKPNRVTDNMLPWGTPISWS